MKTELTLAIERYLAEQCREKRIYGCEEVTIGFYRGGHGNEAVDFCVMDSTGTIRCYEIKVTVADLKSHAAKSFYGNYNYLIISEQIEQKIDDFSPFIPDDVGIKVYDGTGLVTVRNAAKRTLSAEDELMMKESMIRSMYYKMAKYADAVSPEKIRENNAKYNRLFRAYTRVSDELARLKSMVNIHELYRIRICGDTEYRFGDSDAEEHAALEEWYAKKRN